MPPHSTHCIPKSAQPYRMPSSMPVINQVAFPHGVNNLQIGWLFRMVIVVSSLLQTSQNVFSEQLHDVATVTEVLEKVKGLFWLTPSTNRRLILSFNQQFPPSWASYPTKLDSEQTTHHANSAMDDCVHDSLIPPQIRC